MSELEEQALFESDRNEISHSGVPMSFDDFVYQFVYQLLDPNYYSTGRLIIWGMVGMFVMCLAVLTLSTKRTRRKVALAATLLWLGIFALTYFSEWLSAGFSGVPLSVAYNQRRIFLIYPAWLLCGLAVLWGAYGVRWLIERRRRMLSTRSRGFPVTMPGERDK